MTNQEAIEELKARKEHYEMGDGCEFLVDALEMAIEALENQSSVIEELKKIKAEIKVNARGEYDFEGYCREEKISIKEVNKIIDNHIAELKGE